MGRSSDYWAIGDNQILWGNTLDNDHVRVRRLVTERFSWSVFGRGKPGFGRNSSEELEDNRAAGLPVAFQDFHRAATRQVTAAVLDDNGRSKPLIICINGGVGNVDVGDAVSGHSSPFLRQRA
jgi:hypothetical protein